MPMTKVDNDHEQLISMLNQLIDEREILNRENEYLKAKLNESVLIETITEMKKERDLLFKLLSNMTINNNKDEQLRCIKPNIKESNIDLLASPSYPTFNGKLNDSIKQNPTLSRYNPPSIINHSRIHRLKTNIEQQKPTGIYHTKENSMNNLDELSSSSNTHMKNSQTNKKIFVYKTSIVPQTQLIRKPDVQLKHSQNSPFRHYRSQSLQDLT